MITVKRTKYGELPSGDGEAIDAVWSRSIDLTLETSGRKGDNAGDVWVGPGTFTRAVFPTTKGFAAVGEIRMVLRGRAVSLVGERTMRAGVVELTAAELRAAIGDAEYSATLRAWVESNA